MLCREVPWCPGASGVSGWPGIGCDVSAQLVRTHAREMRGRSAAGSWFSPPCFMVTNHVGLTLTLLWLRLPWNCLGDRHWAPSQRLSHGWKKSPIFHLLGGLSTHGLGCWEILSGLVEIKHHTAFTSASPAKSNFSYLRWINPLLRLSGKDYLRLFFTSLGLLGKEFRQKSEEGLNLA